MSIPNLTLGEGLTIGEGITISLGGSGGGGGFPYSTSAPNGRTTGGNYIYDASQTSNATIQALIALGNNLVGHTVTNSNGTSQTVVSQSYNSGTGVWNINIGSSLAFGNGTWTYS